MRKPTRKSDDFDSPWKEALDNLFEPFLALLFPAAHADIDWSRGYQTMDKELRQAIPEAEVGPRVVDFLAKVWRKDGTEEWVLIHVEVQSQADTDFPRRMFIYCRRLIERYRRQVASFAVLADQRPSWRPSEFGYNLWDCELRFRFPTVKLLDLRQRRAELEASTNLFASVVLAHLDTQATRDDPGRRKDFKFELVRRLYDRKIPREQVRLIFRVVDWMMKLPEPLADVFHDQVRQVEQEQKMPYVTSIERLATKRGIEQGRAEGLHSGIETALAIRFGTLNRRVLRELRAINDVTRLQKLLRAAKTVSSMDEIRKLWSETD